LVANRADQPENTTPTLSDEWFTTFFASEVRL
jgi:hypothetical protein